MYSPGSALYLAVGLSPHELLNEFFLMIIGLGTDLWVKQNITGNYLIGSIIFIINIIITIVFYPVV